ncbi:DUF636 domain-containing protein [Nannizzia gypsea CBS 118893]|uniref:DUF636 domain-containing protein n=1 Tax=Arthroderma gypseum (strain ATCC MYA-4604 / CBS 118893) TaxID=535722 RepID=E4UX94_ARTGP|nr:DUF636 domain-containing protein [Nannizzia gypsea CBS 118893]EFR02681.1 DUF636 domain-containing protein [Nannizzia gypsea CBS 118893]
MASATTKTKGSCLCGKVRYELEGQPLHYVLCFCNNCRKTTGSLCMANSWYKKEALKITEGKNNLATYLDKTTDSGVVLERSFCVSCGSSVVSENKARLPDMVIVSSGTLDLAEGESWGPPTLEFFCKRKAAWLTTFEGSEKFRTIS